MRKAIALLSVVLLASNISFAAANGKGSDAPANQKGSKVAKNQKGADTPNNGKGTDVPEEVVAEMCNQIGYDFGPGDLQCNRNWFACTEADAGVDFICNLLPELPVNVVKIPLNAIEEGVKMGAECAEDHGLFGLVLFVPCLGLGGLKGAVEGVVGTVAGFFEITGDTPVFHLTDEDYMTQN